MTKKMSFEIPRGFSEEKLEELKSRITFLCDDIINIHFHAPSFYIEFSKEQNPNILQERYQHLLSEVEKMRLIKPKVLHSHTQSVLYKGIETVNEKSFYNGNYIRLVKKLDYLFLEIALKYQAQERVYPIMLDDVNMEKNRYHKKFPQNIYSVFSLPHDYNKIDNIRETETIESDMFRHSNYYLRPCICYHSYGEIMQSVLNKGLTFTASGPCFRHESKWRLDPFRKEQFLMREIILVDDKETILGKRDQIMKDVWILFKELGLIGHIGNASDPFFFYNDSKKATFQLMSNAKYELVYKRSNKDDVAITSFNYCDTELCRTFNIKKQAGEYYHSGCIAFGVERWAAAILDLYGDNANDWPLLLAD